MTYGTASPLPHWKAAMTSKLCNPILDMRQPALPSTYMVMCLRKCASNPLTVWRSLFKKSPFDRFVLPYIEQDKGSK